MNQRPPKSKITDATLDSLRVPPHSIEAEQSVLGGLLLDNQAWDRIGDLVTDGDFYRDEHRRIFRQIRNLLEKAKPADVVTVAEALDAAGEGEQTGGLAYLGELAANTPSAAIAPGTQDRLSVFVQLGAMLAAAPERYPPGTQISVPTVSSRAADTWVFTVGETEQLDLPIGPMRAVPLQRLPRRDYDQKAQLWLAPELGYLPARIRITQANGDYAELNLRTQAAP